MESRGRGLLALSPIAVFLAVYLLTSIAVGDFYRVPITVAFLLSCIYAVCIARGPLDSRLVTFSRGAGNSNVLLMIWIFILAGAFTGSAKAIGSVDATVNALMGIVPPKMLFAGLFLTSCFISMAIGTSVGTIVALVPLGAGMAGQTGISLPFMTAVIVGGAFFGDNLSFISDTTIAATRYAGCRMSDKFKTNIVIVLPAVIIVTVIYLVIGRQVGAFPPAEDFNIVKILPYLLIIVLGIAGCNVTLTLAIGIAVNALLGFCFGDFSWIELLDSMGGGIASMNDLIIVTLLAGGMLEIIRSEGGLDYVINLLTRHIHGPRKAQAAIAAIVSMANVCTANNTIAIISVGDIAREIAERYGISPRKTASLLDTFSCLIQGLIPYGAQLLMAAGIAGISTTEIIPHLYYPFIMGACAILSIVFNYPKAGKK